MKREKSIKFTDDKGELYPDHSEVTVSSIFNITRGEVIAKTSLSPEKTQGTPYPVYSSQTTNQGILGWSDSYDFDGNYLTWTTDGANAGRVFARKGRFRCTNVCGVLVEKAETLGFANSALAEILNIAADKHVMRGVGNPKLMNNVMGKVGFSLPSLPEQKKIAEFFSALDERIELQSQKISLLKEQKKGYLQRVFSRELVFTDDDGNKYPEWEEKKLGGMVDISTGKKDANAMTDDGKYKFFTCSRETYNIDTYAFDCEAILMAGNGNIGEPKYFKGKFDAYQRTYIVHNFNGLNPKYLMPTLEAIFPKVVARETQTGSMPYIRLSTLTDLKVPLPSNPEQEKIAEFFSALDENIELNEQKLELLKEQKKGYLQGIFGT